MFIPNLGLYSTWINLELTATFGAGFSIQNILSDHTHSIREIKRFLVIFPGWWVESSSLCLMDRRMLDNSQVLQAAQFQFSQSWDLWLHCSSMGGRQAFLNQFNLQFCPQISAMCLSVFPKHRDFMATSRKNSEKYILINAGQDYEIRS